MEGAKDILILIVLVIAVIAGLAFIFNRRGPGA